MDLKERLTHQKDALPFTNMAPPVDPKADDLTTLQHVTEVIEQKFMREGNTPEDSATETRMLVGKPNVRKTVDDYDTSNENFAKQAEQDFMPIFTQVEAIKEEIKSLQESLGDNLEGTATKLLNQTQIDREKSSAQEQQGEEDAPSKQKGMGSGPTDMMGGG